MVLALRLAADGAGGGHFTLTTSSDAILRIDLPSVFAEMLLPSYLMRIATRCSAGTVTIGSTFSFSLHFGHANST
jgi:hypothetical protein